MISMHNYTDIWTYKIYFTDFSNIIIELLLYRVCLIF